MELLWHHNCPHQLVKIKYQNKWKIILVYRNIYHFLFIFSCLFTYHLGKINIEKKLELEFAQIVTKNKQINVEKYFCCQRNNIIFLIYFGILFAR